MLKHAKSTNLVKFDCCRLERKKAFVPYCWLATDIQNVNWFYNKIYTREKKVNGNNFIASICQNLIEKLSLRSNAAIL